jgi:uncharacterized membrane protein
MTQFDTVTPHQSKAPRIAALDLARGLALIAMTTFHFSWDLEFFGYAEPGMTAAFGWKWYARGIAFTFLLLAGISFALAHGNGVRKAHFLRRLLQICAAAAVISLATWYMTPDRFVFFGILHQIAAASVIALLFVGLPPLAILASAAVFLALAIVFRSELFEHPALWWTGLGQTLPLSNDYVPVFPWTGAVLLGLAIGKFIATRGLVGGLATSTKQAGLAASAVGFLGKHSLVYYLVHQPVLFALLYLVSQIAPPDRTGAYTSACTKSCLPSGSESFCKDFCGCVQITLEAKGIFAEVLDGIRDVASDPEILDTAAQCTAKAAEQQP